MIEYFSYGDYIGNWVLNGKVIIDKEQILEDISIIREVPEEFDFDEFDIMLAALNRGVEESELTKIFSKSFEIAELKKRANRLIKRTRK